ncbi:MULTISPECIES: hypothetical protein [unclassified Streptomyces]|uniref:hypothetical protein n=1 Tax=unclassified Streptomyces TaxID=2593676 RepID=UPI0036E61E42
MQTAQAYIGRSPLGVHAGPIHVSRMPSRRQYSQHRPVRHGRCTRTAPPLGGGAHPLPRPPSSRGLRRHREIGNLAPPDQECVLGRRSDYEHRYRELIERGAAAGAFEVRSAGVASYSTWIWASRLGCIRRCSRSPTPRNLMDMGSRARLPAGRVGWSGLPIGGPRLRDCSSAH